MATIANYEQPRRPMHNDVLKDFSELSPTQEFEPGKWGWGHWPDGSRTIMRVNEDLSAVHYRLPPVLAELVAQAEEASRHSATWEVQSLLRRAIGL